MAHGDAHGVVTIGNGLRGKTVSLGTQNDGQLVCVLQPGILQGDGIVTQRHGNGPEAKGFDLLQALPYLLGGLAGGLVGGRLMGRVSVVWLRRIFAAFLLYGGVRYLL